MKTTTCIAYRADGRLCGDTADIHDYLRQGHICRAHAALDVLMRSANLVQAVLWMDDGGCGRAEDQPKPNRMLP